MSNELRLIDIFNDKFEVDIIDGNICIETFDEFCSSQNVLSLDSVIQLRNFLNEFIEANNE